MFVVGGVVNKLDLFLEEEINYRSKVNLHVQGYERVKSDLGTK